MPAEVPQLRKPELLSQVEQRIGLDFFADPQLETMAHEAPASLPWDEVVPRIPLYTAGVRVLALEHRAERTQTTDPSLAARVREQVADVRGGLMLLDRGLQTPAVSGLRRAIQHMQWVSTADGKDRHRRKPADVLRPDVMPVAAVDGMLNLSRGGTLVSLRYHQLEPAARLKLPGTGRGEVCVNWPFVASLAARHGMRDPEQQIDWDRLPQGPEDTDPERVAYARQIQKKYVDEHKLRNVPDIEPDPPTPEQLNAGIAQPYHISQSVLSKIMGGGYHFAAEYCAEHNISFRYLRRLGFGYAHYLALEDAARVWDAYTQIPQADENYVTVIDVARAAGFGQPKNVLGHLLPAEQGAVVPMRARRPAGRILDHLPVAVATRLKHAETPITLPPHL